jgi:hypothetical protein
MRILAGPYGTLGAENLARFRESEATAVWFHGFNAELFDRCATAGAAACVEFRTFRADLDERPELAPIGRDGAPLRRGRLFQGVCLSRTEFIAEREEELRSGLAQFEPEGVWLDYLTYPGWFETPEPDLQESCFCSSCVAEFNEAASIDCQDPSTILAEHALAWERHKCERIASFARRFAAIIRGARPGTTVGVYACPWYPDEFDRALTRIFAQDFALLGVEVDVITPLVYATKCGRATGWIGEYLRRAPAFIPAAARLEPIVDALDVPGALEALEATCRAEPVLAPAGLQVFGGDRLFADAAQAEFFDRAVRAVRLAYTGNL